MISIRSATVDDAGSIARIQIETWRMAYSDLLPPEYLASLSIPHRTETYRVNLARQTDRVAMFVAEEQGRVLGFSGCGPLRDEGAEGNVAELYTIYVLQADEGKGAGSALIRAAEGWMRAGSFASAMLWVLEGNHPARGFYERMGWRDDGGRKDDDIGGVIVREARYVKTFP